MDIDAIINMLDKKTTAEVSRIKVLVSEGQDAEIVKEVCHHGCCDIGSPWATGIVGNCDLQ